MPLYLFSCQVPELKHLPCDEREEIVEAAVFGIPTTVRGLLTVSGVVMPTTAAAFGLSLVFGRWVVYAYLPIGSFVLWVLFLNMARQRIRELVRTKEQQSAGSSSAPA
jgi:hypothetical protein